MLVLSRKAGQEIIIGDNIVVKVVECGASRVALGISAPPEVRVSRGELERLPAPRLPKPGVTVGRPGGKILIVDDSPVDRELYRRLLTGNAECEYQFVEAASAGDGLDMLESAAPDCVLLDYRLPDFDGVEFLEQLQQKAGQFNCPVVMLTNYQNPELALRARERGACDFLNKGGLTAETLCQRVHAAMSDRAQRATSA